MNPTTVQPNTTPDAFKSLILSKYPNGVSSDGTKYADMSAQDLTQKIVSKFPDGVTNDGRKYSDFLTNGDTQPNSIGTLLSPLKQGISNLGTLYGGGEQGIASKLGQDVQAGAQDIQKGGFGNFVKGVAKSGFRTAGDVAGTIFAPVGAALGSTGINNVFSNIQQNVEQGQGLAGKIVNKITDIPAVQNFAVNHPNAGEDFGRLMNLILAGGEKGTIEPTTMLGRTADQVKSNVVNPAVNKINSVANNLQEATLKLTPTQKANLGSKLTDVKNYLTDNKINGNPEDRFQQVNTAYTAKENTLQDVLNKTDVTIPRQQIIDGIEGLKSQFINDRDVIAIEKQLEDAIDTIKRQPENIPAKSLNQLKRSTMEGAFNKAGTKVRDDVEFAIGDALKNNLNSSLENSGVTIEGKTINDFNKEYGTIINARKILKLAQARPQLGFAGQTTSRIISGIIGGMFGGIPGEIAGGILGKQAGELLAGTNAKSTIASFIKRKPIKNSENVGYDNSNKNAFNTHSDVPNNLLYTRNPTIINKPINNPSIIPEKPTTKPINKQAGFVNLAAISEDLKATYQQLKKLTSDSFNRKGTLDLQGFGEWQALMAKSPATWSPQEKLQANEVLRLYGKPKENLVTPGHINNLVSQLKPGEMLVRNKEGKIGAIAKADFDPKIYKPI